MHFLVRGEAPNCLADYRYGQDHWGQVTAEDKAAIRAELESMQGRRCAYCECGLDLHGQHIEHFRQRVRFPQGTFEWANLFLSCERAESCGKHKDSCGLYPHEDLIKPDIDDPEKFFRFGPDGTIHLREGLSPQQAHRANETLRIFNLDAQWGPLRQMRKIVCQGYSQTRASFQEIAQHYPQEEWWPLLQEELATIESLPFCTAIKHTLSPD